ncbi:hypothetical protein NPIL_297781 [Nephila pilipes]|uniref:Uncharacterized protein n=1 Tax=Nephila pilipes TaxID=299642 RepID=A0A8X6P794_NEPPI|nr:hypothetical protein NPIL_297781 [Nephila pilipes]
MTYCHFINITNVLSGVSELIGSVWEQLREDRVRERQNEKGGRLMRADDDTLIGIDEKRRPPERRNVLLEVRKEKDTASLLTLKLKSVLFVQSQQDLPCLYVSKGFVELLTL